MLNPIDLQNAIVDRLRAIHELVDLIVDIADIQAYDDESQIAGSREMSESSMMGRSVMVTWTGAELPRMGETRGWRHTFKIALKAESITAYYAMAASIIDGVPDGYGGDNFLNCDISTLTDGIQECVVEPEKGDDGIGRLQITFSITER